MQQKKLNRTNFLRRRGALIQFQLTNTFPSSDSGLPNENKWLKLNSRQLNNNFAFSPRPGYGALKFCFSSPPSSFNKKFKLNNFSVLVGWVCGAGGKVFLSRLHLVFFIHPPGLINILCRRLPSHPSLPECTHKHAHKRLTNKAWLHVESVRRGMQGASEKKQNVYDWKHNEKRDSQLKSRKKASREDAFEWKENLIFATITTFYSVPPASPCSSWANNLWDVWWWNCWRSGWSAAESRFACWNEIEFGEFFYQNKGR